MRRAVVLVVLVALVLVGAWWLSRSETLRTSEEARVAGAVGPTVVAERDEPEPEPERAAAPLAAAKPKRVGSKEEREAMRRRILDTLSARERAAAERGGPTGSEDEPGAREAEPKGKLDPTAAEEEPHEPGELVDQTGGDLAYLAKVMNEDLLPLADECYALAREAQPELAGLLVLDFEIIGDEDIGGVVESVGIGSNNELVDPGLVECMHESILSLTLPAPQRGGREAVSISLRLEPEEG